MGCHHIDRPWISILFDRLKSSQDPRIWEDFCRRASKSFAEMCLHTSLLFYRGAVLLVKMVILAIFGLAGFTIFARYVVRCDPADRMNVATGCSAASHTVHTLSFVSIRARIGTAAWGGRGQTSKPRQRRYKSKPRVFTA
jgi:hypothetical protein